MNMPNIQLNATETQPRRDRDATVPVRCQGTFDRLVHLQQIGLLLHARDGQFGGFNDAGLHSRCSDRSTDRRKRNDTAHKYVDLHEKPPSAPPPTDTIKVTTSTFTFPLGPTRNSMLHRAHADADSHRPTATPNKHPLPPLPLALATHAHSEQLGETELGQHGWRKHGRLQVVLVGNVHLPVQTDRPTDRQTDSHAHRLSISLSPNLPTSQPTTQCEVFER